MNTIHTLLLLLAAAPALHAQEIVTEDKFAGPSELQDTFLPSQFSYQAYPENARLLRPGGWLVNVTADWTAHLAQTADYLFDGESVTSTLKVRHSPFARWEFGFDLPHTWRVGGVADEFIEFVETSLNAKVLARYSLPRDTYQANLTTPSGAVISPPKGHGFGDLTLRAKMELTREKKQWVDSAFVATLSLPTGQESYGGQGFSPGLGLHAQRTITEKVALFGGIGGNFYSDPFYHEFEFNSLRGMGYAGANWKPARWFGLIVEYQVYTPFAGSNAPLNSTAHYYSVTGRFFFTKDLFFETGVVENLGVVENRNSSDVTFKFALTQRL